MSKVDSFIKSNQNKANFISLVFSNFFYYGIQYLILILFTKNYSQEEVGIYIYALTFIKPIFIPLNLQLRSLFVTETDEQLKIQDYHSLRIIGNVITVLSVLIIAYLSNIEQIPILMLILFIKIIESQSEMCHAVYQKKQEMVFIGVSKTINGILIIAVVYLGLVLNFKFENVILAWVLISLSVLLFLDIPMARKKDLHFLRFKEYFNFKKVKKIFFFAWTLFFLEIVMKYYESYPNLSVKKYFGLETLAIFGSIIYFKAIGGQILTQIINLVEPKLSNLYGLNKIKKFNQLVLKLVILGAFIGGFLVIILNYTGEYILRFLFTEEYAKHSKLLFLIAISSGISYLYSFLSTSLTCMRKHYIKVPISVIGLVLLIIMVTLNQNNLTIYKFVNYLIYTETIICILYFISYFYYLKTNKNEI